METTYSKEYIAKIVGAIIAIIVVILPQFGINVLPEQIEAATQALTGVLTLGLWLYTLYRQSRKENLSALGKYTYSTPTYLRDR